MSLKSINPESLGSPRGYTNGILAETPGKLLFIAGQVAWNERQQIVSDDFVEQFDRALANVLEVVSQAGGRVHEVARLVIYVTDRDEYERHLRAIGERYRARMGKHFPAMSLIEVKRLLEPQARVEIEGTAVISV